MRVSMWVGVAVGVLAVVALSALVFGLSFERAALLAPAIVICVGGALALLILWGKAALDVWRRRRVPSDPPRSVSRPDDLDDRTLRAGRRG
jgi:hypothetical protein